MPAAHNFNPLPPYRPGVWLVFHLADALVTIFLL